MRDTARGNTAREHGAGTRGGNTVSAPADTTCANGDKSTHYWPVLLLRDGREFTTVVIADPASVGEDQRLVARTSGGGGYGPP